MAMVSAVNWQPTGGLVVQADRLGSKVGGPLAPCCTHRVNHGELSQCFKHDDSTINIVEVLLLLLLLLLLLIDVTIILLRPISFAISQPPLCSHSVDGDSLCDTS